MNNLAFADALFALGSKTHRRADKADAYIGSLARAYVRVTGHASSLDHPGLAKELTAAAELRNEADALWREADQLRNAERARLAEIDALEARLTLLRAA
jgi:hypothetical protein